MEPERHVCRTPWYWCAGTGCAVLGSWARRPAKRKAKQRSMQDFVCETEMETNAESDLTNEAHFRSKYYMVVNTTLADFRGRFSDTSCAIIGAMKSLSPRNGFALFYEDIGTLFDQYADYFIPDDRDRVIDRQSKKARVWAKAGCADGHGRAQPPRWSCGSGWGQGGRNRSCSHGTPHEGDAATSLAKAGICFQVADDEQHLSGASVLSLLMLICVLPYSTAYWRSTSRWTCWVFGWPSHMLEWVVTRFKVTGPNKQRRNIL